MSDRNISTIEQELKQTREQMTDTVDQLLNSLSPKNNVKWAKANLLDKAHGWLNDAGDLMQRAKSGDKSAQKILVAVGAGTGVALSLLIRKILH